MGEQSNKMLLGNSIPKNSKNAADCVKEEGRLVVLRLLRCAHASHYVYERPPRSFERARPIYRNVRVSRISNHWSGTMCKRRHGWDSHENIHPFAFVGADMAHIKCQ